MGPNVGDITTEYKPPRRGRVMLIHIEAHEDKEYGALPLKLRGLGPKGGLGPIVINRHEMYNLCCKIEVAETEPDTIMSRPRDSVNRRVSTHVYKGTTRRRFRDNR